MRAIQASVLSSVVLSSGVAWSQTPAVEASTVIRESPVATITHTPVGLHPSRTPLRLEFTVAHPDLMSELGVYWRPVGRRTYSVLRASRDESAWSVVVPAQEPAVQGIDYMVRMRPRAGPSVDVFATQEDPHRVVLRPDDDEQQELVELSEHRQQRLEFFATADYANLGTRANTNLTVCGVAAGDRCPDWWYSLSGGVRYRFFRRVRSVSARVERLEGVTTRQGPTGDVSRSVGLVAATTEVEFRLAPWAVLAISATLGANETKVQGGGGARLELGADRPTRIVLAVQGITDFGYTASAWMRWDTVRNTPMGAGVEAGSLPGNQETAVRLLYEIGRQIGPHVTLLVRGGYGARRQDAGGPSLGLSLRMAF